MNDGENKSSIDSAAPPVEAATLNDSTWRRVLFEESFQPAWIYDLKTLAILDVNQAAILRYGYSREEFLAMTLKDIRPREDIPALLDQVANFESGRQISGEWRHLCRDGRILYAEVQSHELEFDSRPARLAIINDVTERHLAEESLKKTIQDYRGLFEHAHDAILIVTADDARVLDVNQHACELYGYSRGEFLGLEMFRISKEPDRCHEHLERVLSQGSFYQFESIQFRKDGSEMYLEANAAVVTYKDQQAVLVINRDVSERKRFEEKMRGHEQRRRLQVQRTPLGVIDWDPQFYIRAWNPAAEAIFGFTAEEAIGRTGPDLILPEEVKPQVAEIWSALVASSGGLRSTNKNITKDGRTILCEWYNTTLVDAAGNVVGATSLVQDITASEESRKAIEQSEERYRALAEAVPAIVYSSAPTTGVTNYYNRRWYDYTGMSEADSLGDKWAQAIHPDDLEPLLAEWKRCGDQAEPCQVEFRLRGKDGEYRWFLSRSIPMRNENGEIVRWVGTSTDIDRIKRAQSELQHQKEILQTIFDHIPVMVSFFDSAARYVVVNRAWEQSLGYSAADARSRDLLPDLYPDPAVLSRVREFISRADGRTWVDFPTKRSDGGVLDTNWIDIRVPDGTTIGLGLDVTEQRAAERKLQDSEEKFRQIAENIEEVFWIMTPDRKILYINPAYGRIWQQSVRDLYDDPRSWMKSIHPEDMSKAWSDDPLSWDRQFRLLRPDGSIRWIHTRAMPVRDADGQTHRVVGIAQDITAQKELEEHLRRHADELNEMVRQRTERIRDLERLRTESEKLVATGRMAARVAHEINNPLTGIDFAFGVIKNSIPADDQYFPFVARIERNIERITKIIRQMYELYRPETEKPQTFNLRSLLEEAINLLAPEAAKRAIRIELNADGEWNVTLPEQAVRQVVLNIIRNAVEASPDADAVHVKLASLGPQMVTLSVIDRGKGIDPEIRDELFEPFVTTKTSAPSSGLGLGLSISRSLVLAMGGTIEFESGVGADAIGTTFRVSLPRVMSEREKDRR